MPKARWCSALLIRISTLPPISAASSRTFFESVTSSGSRVTWETLLNASKPENFFHGSAYPTQMSSAPAWASAFTIAWPAAVLPSVTSTLRNFGSQVNSRNCRSFAMLEVSFSGSAASTACPARSSRAATRTRAGGGGTPPAAASAAACAGPGFCVLACLASEDRRAGTETTVEVDHAEAADEAEFRILDLALLRLAGQLPQRLHHAEEAARGASLPDRELPAAGIERKAAVVREAVLAYESRRLALAAEAEVFELQERNHRVVVVGLDEIHVARPGAGLRVEILAIERPAGAHLHRIRGKGIMPFDGPHQGCERNAERFCTLFAPYQKSLGTRARHDAVEQMQRLGDRPRRQVFFQCQGFLEKRVRIPQRIGALRHAQLAEILARRAVDAHVVRREKGEARVRAARAVGIDCVACELAEIGERQPKGVDVIGVAGDARDDVRVTRLHRARRAPQGDHAAGAAERQVVEPARRQAEVLREADRRVGRQREARDAQSVDRVLL